jgi:hypothetical protein
MTAQRFESFNAMRTPSGNGAYPEIAFQDAQEEAKYVAFIEQAFEWENMTYLLYPYFWGRKAEWERTAQVDEMDVNFAKFLSAGFARVQVPVRPGFEALVTYTFDRNNWSGTLWQGSNPPGFETNGVLAIEDEMQAQTGGLDYIQGKGRISIAANDVMVVGIDTEFSQSDVDRELQVDNQIYSIAGFVDETHVVIASPGPEKEIKNIQYALGPKLDGLPWEVTVPTTLIYLQDNSNLNP